LKRSKLAKKLGLDSIPQQIIGPTDAAHLAGVKREFIKSEIETGSLSTLVYVPGFYRILTWALEAWYERLPWKVLHANRCKFPAAPSGALLRPYGDLIPYRLQSYANKLVCQAVKLGYLQRGRCMFCAEQKAVGHHPDYSKPLSVTWLCHRHHLMQHGRMRAAEDWIKKTRRPAQLTLFPVSWIDQCLPKLNRKVEAGA
jgi:hypothetical protein